ncbi:MAG: hypothetical protein HKP58_07925 [Desulfatitalea sp.]|nr:hypothetical protein [Desulfatitalea sp.]NNK00328.1 hypothetical protein [Desulfatitalea sp.]
MDAIGGFADVVIRFALHLAKACERKQWTMPCGMFMVKRMMIAVAMSNTPFGDAR